MGPPPAGLDQLENIIGNVISVIVGLGFIAMFVFLIMAGIKYLTSGGEPKAIQSAHYTLTWALLGLFLMAIAWLALQLIANFTGINVTVFNIKTLCKDGGDLLKFCQPN
ncbi:pilin [Patescibacteria group bacterium]|nr:pilin [Patescibacteria group bacterium]